MQPETENRKPKTLIVIIAMMVMAVIVYIYSHFDPVEYGRYFPGCMMKRLTSLSCPSCGNQRALHALLNGDFADALRYNLFLPFGIAYVIGMLVGHILAVTRTPRHPVYQFFWGIKGGYTFLAVAILWMIIRNILDI